MRVKNEGKGVQFRSMRASPSLVVSAAQRTVRRRIPSEDAELLELLERILDKGLFMGSANLLTLGHTNLSRTRTRISVLSAQTNSDSYTTPARALRFGEQTRKETI